jgi:glyoxylase-like metal-dependent hydrolase (beta-lactamase superfamily II)
MTPAELPSVLQRVGAQLIVRGWLSANNIVFADPGSPTTAVVDTSYFSHAEQTVQLVEQALAGRALKRIVNTHLHSDHCGGNRALQDRYPSATITTPVGFRQAVEPWDEGRLSFQDTGQHCPPFHVNHFLGPGDRLSLGTLDWEVHAAPGHDPDALMFFEPRERLLISGDALWERRLAIIFPELAGEAGFAAAHRTLDSIERLSPRWVLPGHGGAFGDVAGALRRSRERLDSFAAQPHRHREHAARALAMFHMLEMRARSREQLEAWMVATPIFHRALAAGEGARAEPYPTSDPDGDGQPGQDPGRLAEAAKEVIDSLVEDQILILQDRVLSIAVT